MKHKGSPTRMTIPRVSAVACACLALTARAEIEIDPDATIHDSPTTLMGVNHIGLSVKDLERTLDFYKSVSGFELVFRQSVRNSAAADQLFGVEDVVYEIAVLEAPNMLFEFIEFEHNANLPMKRMPVNGPGMTHTCFQSTSNDSAYEKFGDAGAAMLSYSNQPIDLGGYGVTYAYGYDPEGNMFEMEQLDPGPLAQVEAKVRWVDEGYSMWMTQVAVVTHDIERLTKWYSDVMAFMPYRVGDYEGHPRMAQVAGEPYLSLLASWFRMDSLAKTIELWQYRDPITPEPTGKKGVTDFGYTYSIEVGDIAAEYNRMRSLGVEFVSEPVDMGEYHQVYAYDIDGNVFALRQWHDPNSQFSLPNLEQ